ncbi:MAG TPA: divalent cation transporter [Nitrososphaeraceae archaeon]|nr:divalent cation transporter [Nitrososphaeraceae archaeon]
MIVIAIIPFIVLTAMLVFLLGPGMSLLNAGISLPEITIEKIEFQKDRIVAYIRNTGPEQIEIAQADINDRIIPAAIEPTKTLSRLSEAKVIVPFSWNAGVPYEVGVTTSDGTRFSKSVEAAALAPTPNIEQASYFAVIGIYVGVIPILIGLLWFPFIKRLSMNKYKFFLSLTAGLLVFLGIDALVESNEILQKNIAGAFNGQVLIVMITIISFLVLLYTSEKLVGGTKTTSDTNIFKSNMISSSTFITQEPQQQIPQESKKPQLAKPLAISMMIAIGIGLHNFGEGLAIGAAVLLGEVALSTFLIVGFTLHNTTEGLAIVAPMAKSGGKVILRKLVIMGLIAGIPTIFGTWIGGFLYSPFAAIIFLAIGAGAIFQVVLAILSWMSSNDSSNESRKETILNTPVIAGFTVGMIMMYITSLLISS